MPHPRRFDDVLYTHFFTFSCYHRRRLLDHDQPKRIFLGVLNDVREKFAAKCIGFVLMPDHVHLLIWFPTPKQLSRFVQQLKGRSSTQIKQFLRDSLTEYAVRIALDDPVWQVRFHSFEIDRTEKLEEKWVAPVAPTGDGGQKLHERRWCFTSNWPGIHIRQDDTFAGAVSLGERVS